MNYNRYMAKEKTIHVEYSDFDEPVSRIEQKLEYYLQEKDQKKLKIDEKRIIADEQFQAAITRARKELGIEYDYLDYEPDLDDWIVELLTGKKIDEVVRYSEKYQDSLEKYNRVAWAATEEANLPYGWHSWVIAYIAMDRPPEEAVIEPDLVEKIEIIGMDDNSLIIRLNKGLRAEEYRNAWKAFSDFLRQSSVYQPHRHLLKHQIYLDRENGMTYRQLADKYFPNESDRQASEDKVKKIIIRHKS